VNYPIPIALGIALIDALPILGPATIYIPWVISKLVMSEYTTALSLFILYLIVTLARQALEPKILSTQIGIYPLITLLAMYIGLKTLGFAGIILGPVSVILLLALFKTGVLPTPAMFELNLERNKNNSDLDDLFF
jgi:predicted PurR-regulated permease PerM